MEEEKKKKQSWKVEIPIEEIPSLPEGYNEYSKILYRVNEDLIGHLMVWDDIDKLPDKEWVNFWKSVKSEKIRIRKLIPVKYRKKHVNMFDKYSMDELRKIYENRNIGIVTQYFIIYLSKHNEHDIISSFEYGGDKCFWFSTVIRQTNYKIQELQYRSEKELSELIIKLSACEFLYQLLSEDDNNHSADYDFVINNLQYATIEDLKLLEKLSNTGFVRINKGRKSRNKKIFKYDLQHNLLNTYPNRNACIDAEQLSKQSLYNVLSGKRKTLKGFIYEEEQ